MFRFNMSNCHPLEASVGRGGETQIQVGENLNKITFTYSAYVSNKQLLFAFAQDYH